MLLNAAAATASPLPDAKVPASFLSQNDKSEVGTCRKKNLVPTVGLKKGFECRRVILASSRFIRIEPAYVVLIADAHREIRIGVSEGGIVDMRPSHTSRFVMAVCWPLLVASSIAQADSICDSLFKASSEFQFLSEVQLQIPKGQWFIPSAEVDALSKKMGLDLETTRFQLTKLAATRTVSPLSNFAVGAIGVTAKGDVILGTNIEFKGAALGQALHAERTVLLLALDRGERLVKLYTTTPPCGGCRQWLNEIEGGRKLQIVTPDAGGSLVTRTLGDLLPLDFAPEALGLKGLFDARQYRTSRNDWLLPDLSRELSKDENEALLQSFERSYAPNSKSPAGALIRLKSGDFVTGAYIENAAFESYPAFTAAYAKLVMSGFTAEQITDIYMMQAAGATAEPVNHQAVSRLVLNPLIENRSPLVGNVNVRLLRVYPRH